MSSTSMDMSGSECRHVGCCDFSTWCFEDKFWMTNKEANDLFGKVWSEKPGWGEDAKTYIWKGEPTYEGSSKRTIKRIQFSIKWDGVEMVGIGSETERWC